jgi:hypothetical protein
MSIIYFNGTEEDEQSKGAVLDSGAMLAYAINTKNPTQLISLGGHFMDDAPTYNITEPRVLPVYRHVNGRNIIEETQLTEDTVKSITFNLMLPKRAISVTDRLYQNQKNCELNLAFAPDTCDEDCDSYFWVAKDARFGVKQITNTILGYDENANPIDTMRTVRATGNLVQYNGLTATALPTAAGDIHGIDIVYERCEGCGTCPYQKIVRAGVGFAEVSEDGGATWTAIDVTTITTDEIGATLTDVKYVNGNYVVTYADLWPAMTDGGAAYSVDGADFVLSTFDVEPTGLAGLVEAFGKLWAYGTDGSLYYSCDNGVTFTQLVTGEAEDFLHAAYDKYNNVLVLGGANNTLYRFNGTVLTDISASVAWAAGTSDVLSVANFGKGRFGIGTNDGSVFEHSDILNASATNQFTLVRQLAATTLVGGLVGDDLGARILWGEAGTAALDIQLRDVFTKMQPESVYSGGANLTVYAAVAGKPLADEGYNYFLFGLDGGGMIQVAACNLCIQADC